MMLLVINPNTTQSMTDKIEAAARAVAAPETEITAVNPTKGPTSIEGHYDGAFSVPGLIDEVRNGMKAGAHGFVIACFDDTGLDAARSIATAPVIGIAEAAMHVAVLIGGSFSVVGTPAGSVPVIESLVLRYGYERHCRGVHAAGFPVLALDDPRSGASKMLRADVQRVVADDQPDSIILGCAGEADLAKTYSQEFGLPVIDGVAAAVKLAEALYGLDLSTSKKHGYAAPPDKSYTGGFSLYAP
uniref:Asp/Glu racemase n=1 Tax=Salinispora arenicola (strain CNS-205) TaxID=391037 RepID=A8M8B5_SALAI